MKRWTLILAFFVCVISIITGIDAIAHQPEEIELTKAREAVAAAEGKCRTAARNLSELDNIQRIAKSDWDDNNEDMRDQSISSIGSGGDLSITSLFSDAAILGLDLSESMSLSDILSSAISATQSKKQELVSLLNKRDSAHSILGYFIDIHNFRHNTPSVDFDLPEKEDFEDDLEISEWDFSCAGGCGMTMDSPISSHRDSCGGCGKYYHSCNADDVALHGERPCTRKIKVVTEVYDPNWGSTYYVTTHRNCTVKHRWCTITKAPHEISVKANGATILGPRTIHYPKRRTPPPPVGLM